MVRRERYDRCNYGRNRRYECIPQEMQYRITKNRSVECRRIERNEEVVLKLRNYKTGKMEIWRERWVYYAPTSRLPGRWVALGGELDSICSF